jgi:hypothetical protein
MSYAAVGADALQNTFVTLGGVRYFDPLSQARILAALSSMSPSAAVAGQMPTIDAQGASVTVTPGLVPNLPNAAVILNGFAQVGNAVLAPEAFAEGSAQTLRLVMNQAALPGLTDSAQGGKYAVLLPPAGAPAIPGLPTLNLPLPATPGAPPAAPSTPAAPASPAPTIGARIGALSTSAKIGLGAGVAVLVGLVMSAMRSKGK